MVHFNAPKAVSLVYKTKKVPDAGRSAHTFGLQQTMRLASKFTGATHTVGKSLKLQSMEVRPLSIAETFEE